MAETIDNDAFSRRRRRRFLHHRGRGRARDYRRRRLTGEHLRAQAGGEESVLPRRGADRRHRGPGDLGQELSAAIRRLQAHRGPGAHALRRQRGRAAHADPGRPALGRRAVEARGGPAPEDDVGRLRVLRRISARSAATPTCWTTRRSPSASRSSSSRARASTATPRSTCRTRRLGDGDLIKGFEKINQMPYAEARKLVDASGRLHRLPRSGNDAAARHAARRSSKASARSRPRRA